MARRQRFEIHQGNSLALRVHVENEGEAQSLALATVTVTAVKVIGQETPDVLFYATEPTVDEHFDWSDKADGECIARILTTETTDLEGDYYMTVRVEVGDDIIELPTGDYAILRVEPSP